MAFIGTQQVYAPLEARANAAGASNDQVLVGAPGDGRHIVVDYFYVSAAGSGDFIFETSTTSQIGPRMQLASGVPHVSGEVRIKCGANEPLTWTSTGGSIGNHSVFVVYHIEGV